MQDYLCDLTPMQAYLYEQWARDQAAQQGELADPKAKAHIFQVLNQLKKICNHPLLAIPSADVADLQSRFPAEPIESASVAAKFKNLK